MSDEHKLALVAGITLFLELADTALIPAIAIPLSHSFNVGVTQISRPVLWYSIGACLFVPTISWMCKAYSPKKILLWSIVLFMGTSAVCGLSQSMGAFTCARFLQGVSISLTSPVAMIILMEVCEKDKVVFYNGIVNMPGMLGISFGPAIGGILSYYFSWRYAFYANIPVCIFLFLFIWTSIDIKTQHRKRKIDLLGFLLLSSGIILITAGVDSLQREELQWSLYFIPVGMAAIMIFFFIHKKKQSGILDFSVFKDESFLIGAIINLITRISMTGIPIVLAVFLQQHYHNSIREVGISLSVIGIAGAIAKLFSGYITKVGLRASLLISISMTAFCIISTHYLSGNIYCVRDIAILFLFGFFMSILYTAMNGMMLVSISVEKMGDACNIQAIIQQLFTGFGIVFALLMYSYFKKHTGELVLSYQLVCIASATIMAFAAFIILCAKKKHVYQAVSE